MSLYKKKQAFDSVRQLKDLGIPAKLIKPINIRYNKGSEINSIHATRINK